MSVDTLKSLAGSIRDLPLSDLAARATDTQLEAAGWRVDLSRQYVNVDINEALLNQAAAANLGRAIQDLFAAEIVNPSEDRPALHWALRMTPESDQTASERDTTVRALAKAAEIAQQANLRAIVHIGIGGSDFGPRLYADAFADRKL